MTDFLTDKRREINTRLAELKPLIDEYDLLEQAQAALAHIPTSTNGATAAPKRRGPGRPRKSTIKPASRSKRVAAKSAPADGSEPRGRRPGSGKRPVEALAAIKAQPGITAPEIATKLGISPNYLYRVLPTLEKDGKIVKKGRGFEVTGTD